jgi:branched-chain amino acid transport system substrate-binding protein
MAKKGLNWLIPVIIIAAVVLLIIFLPKAAPQAVKIGAVLPLSGPAAVFGEDARNGLLMAAEEINAKGKVNITLIIEDGQADVKTSISAFNKLTDIDDAKIDLTFVSGIALALKPLAKEKGILFFADASHPNITDAENPLVFRHSQLGDQEAGLLFQKAEDLKAKNIGVLLINDDYSYVFLNEFTAEAKQANITLNHELFDKKATDVKTELTKLMAANPDTIILVGYSPLIATAAKTLKELNFKGNIIASFGFSSLAPAAGESAKGIYYTEFKLIGSEKSKSFEDGYKERYGRTPSVTAALFYEDLLLISSAIESAGSDPAKLANHIRKLKTFDAGIESLTIDGQDILPEIEIRQWK